MGVLAARHGAGSRKAAGEPSVSLYGKDVMRRNFLLSESTLGIGAPRRTVGPTAAY